MNSKNNQKGAISLKNMMQTCAIAHNLPRGNTYLKPFGAICPFLIALHFPRWPIFSNICSLISELEALSSLSSYSLTPSFSSLSLCFCFFSFWPFLSLIPRIHPPFSSLNVGYLPLLLPLATTTLTHPSPSLLLHPSPIVPDALCRHTLSILSHPMLSLSAPVLLSIHPPLPLLWAKPLILYTPILPVLHLPHIISISNQSSPFPCYPSILLFIHYFPSFFLSFSLLHHSSFTPPPSILMFTFKNPYLLSSSSSSLSPPLSPSTTFQPFISYRLLPLLSPCLHPSFAFKSYLSLHILPSLAPFFNPSNHIRSYQSSPPVMSSMNIFSCPNKTQLIDTQSNCTESYFYTRGMYTFLNRKDSRSLNTLVLSYFAAAVIFH